MISHPMMSFQGLARTCAAYAHQSWMGISPFAQPLPTPCVHHRFQTSEERREQQRLEQSQHELAHLSSVIQRSQRHDRNKRIGRNICLLIDHMAVEESREELRRICQERNALRADAIKQAGLLKKAATKMRGTTQALAKAQEDIKTHEEHHREQRDELCLMIQKERHKVDAAENCRQVAVVSLRNRWKNEKTRYDEITRTLDSMLQEKEIEVREAKSFADKLVEYIERLERKMTDMKNDRTGESVSRQLSLALSDMSKVGLARPDDGQSVGEKMRDLRDGVKDLVTELRSRRENSARLQDRIFRMEEERLMWEFEDTKHGAERVELVRLVHEANAVIAALRDRRGPVIES